MREGGDLKKEERKNERGRREGEERKNERGRRLHPGRPIILQRSQDEGRREVGPQGGGGRADRYRKAGQR
jgi:hypothetical protein